MSGVRLAAVSGALAVWLSGLTVAAQPSPEETSIVVTGERNLPTSREISRQARQISVIDSPLDNPLPRFEARVCPGVMGLTADAAAYVIQRLRSNAEEFGIPTQPDDGTCEPNLIVAFVEDAQAELTELVNRNRYMVADLAVDQREEMLEASGAARVWMNTETRTNTGTRIPSARDARSAGQRTISLSSDGNPMGVDLPPVAAGSASHSRIYLPVREDIISVLVLFDQDLVRGKSLLQLADYASMRGFAFTRETRGEMAAGTILGLFDGDGPKPERLTSFDRGFLRSLYRDLPNLPAAAKLGTVNRYMEREAERAGR